MDMIDLIAILRKIKKGDNGAKADLIAYIQHLQSRIKTYESYIEELYNLRYVDKQDVE